MWRKPSLLILSCLPLCGGGPAYAGEPKTADEVIAKYIEAIGGRQKLDSIQTRRITAKSTFMGGREARFVMELKRPNKTHVEFTIQGMTGTHAYDGKIGWFISPFMGKTDPEKMTPEQVEMLDSEADMDGPLVDYQKKGHQVELVGKEEMEGAEAYKLKVTKKGGNVDYYYLDSEYFLPIKVKGKRELQGSEIEYDTSFGDYKNVDGLLVAHSVQHTGPMGENTMTYDKVELNVELPDDRFAMPEIKKEEPPEPKTEAITKEKKEEDAAEKKD